MRIAGWRAVCAGVLAAGMAGAAALAQPPEVLPPARSEPRPLANVGDEDLAAERARLKRQLDELLRALKDRPPITDRVPTGPTRPPTGPLPRPKFDFPEGGKSIDGLRVAANLYRDNDFDAAFRAFRLIDQSLLSREDRAFVQYMTACTLRRLNRRAEAATIFREVADAKDDEFISECAVWQLSLLRSSQDLEAQLEQLRARPKSR